jgi:hypothetical protein
MLAWSISGSAVLLAHDLYDNEPDPFCPDAEMTVVSFGLHEDALVRLKILDHFDNRVDFLVNEEKPPGLHEIGWDGIMASGDTARTGIFTIRLEAGDEIHTEQCVTYCGDDLCGPYRMRPGGKDSLVAFAVGLAAPSAAELRVFASDGATPVCTVFDGSLDDGVFTLVWDLKDDLGTRVKGATYVCRFTTPTYSEDIAFWINHPIEPVSFTCGLEDAHGVYRVGAFDSLSPQVVETPLGGMLLSFGRSLSGDELDRFWETFGLTGSMRYVSLGDIVTVAPDTSWIQIAFLDNWRRWEDIFGLAGVSADSEWMDPWASYFHFKHPIEGITWMSNTCDSCGDFDPDDWQCWEPDSSAPPPPGWEAHLGGIEPADSSFTTRLLPSCPNPVIPGTHVAIRYAKAHESPTRVLIVDEEGYLVRTLVYGVLQPGLHTAMWDLRDASGDSLPDGMYHVIYDHGPDSTFVCGGDIWITASWSAADPTAGVGLTGLMLAASPNPVHAGSRAHVSFDLAGPAIVDLAVFDVTGRLTRALLRSAALDAGHHALAWDGLDDRGDAVSAGVYFARLSAGGRSSSRKIVISR